MVTCPSPSLDPDCRDKALTAHRGERGLDTRMGGVVFHRHLLGISAADNRQLALVHRFIPSASDDYRDQA
jgi:hypothetical protein